MLEVCSTTLPQQMIPIVMADPRYEPYLKDRTHDYEEKARIAEEILGTIPELIVHKPHGAFYMTVVFKEGALNNTQTLPIENEAVKSFVEGCITSDFTLDKRFTYYLLGATGLCVVPLTSGFNSTYHGFRFTLLDPDEDSFVSNMESLKVAIVSYLQS
jgi:aspartate/methionine/tyrosine aminotransferase